MTKTRNGRGAPAKTEVKEIIKDPNPQRVERILIDEAGEKYTMVMWEAKHGDAVQFFVTCTEGRDWIKAQRATAKKPSKKVKRAAKLIWSAADRLGKARDLLADSDIAGAVRDTGLLVDGLLEIREIADALDE